MHKLMWGGAGRELRKNMYSDSEGKKQILSLLSMVHKGPDQEASYENRHT